VLNPDFKDLVKNEDVDKLILEKTYLKRIFCKMKWQKTSIFCFFMKN